MFKTSQKLVLPISQMAKRSIANNTIRSRGMATHNTSHVSNHPSNAAPVWVLKARPRAKVNVYNTKSPRTIDMGINWKSPNLPSGMILEASVVESKLSSIVNHRCYRC
jgi:hypothetical protein